MVRGMIVEHEVRNHLRPTYSGQYVSEGRTERIELRGARVYCGDAMAWSDVTLTMRTSDPSLLQYAVTARIEAPPSTLRSALWPAAVAGSARVAFAIVDGGRLDVDTEVHLSSLSSEGPATLTFLADRGAIPWPAAANPEASNIPHVAMGW
jgi:predicted anti-sigma-YlaC factor YlaD